MVISACAVTGFLDAGKTTLINRLLADGAFGRGKTLVVQFESGEEELADRAEMASMRVSRRELEKSRSGVAKSVAEALAREKPTAVLLEWNGVAPFPELLTLLSDPALSGTLRLKKVVHVLDAARIEALLEGTGGALAGQIAECDFAVARGADAEGAKRLRRMLSAIRPGIRVLTTDDLEGIRREMKQEGGGSVAGFAMLLLLMALSYFMGTKMLGGYGIDLNTTINVFLGILLQAVPFLLIGVLLSSAIQIYIRNETVTRLFPKSTALGMLAAVVGGFFLPVCDCASIPIFRSLVRKGVPLPAAVTFMAASPVINPVVLLSTWYAFGGNARIVLARAGLGLLSAILIGLFFAVIKPKGGVLAGGAVSRVQCSCGCYGGEVPSGRRERFMLFLQHAQYEFFDVGKYLLIGTLVSSLFQTAGSGLFAAAKGGAGLILPLLTMMGMAFFLSLCSSSDAVVARSLANSFPMGAIMGFLVLGPMLDVKNALMLSAGFQRRFVVTLCAVIFLVCLNVTYLFALMGGI